MVPIAVIAWYRLHRYAWYRYSAIVSNAGNNTSDHENYARGYEDGYDDCCSDHDCSYNDYHDSGYCDRDEFEGCENDECYDDNCGW